VTSEVAPPISKCAGQSYESVDTFSDSLAQSFQRLWLMISSCAKMFAGVGLKGF